MIKLDEWYNASDIVENSWFPWVTSLPAVTRWIRADMEHENILRAVKRGNGQGTKYYVKGENIINFLAQMDEGKVDQGNIKENT